ncbi:Gibberellin 2-beta-dioxygenase 1 [Linum perenne]
MASSSSAAAQDHRSYSDATTTTAAPPPTPSAHPHSHDDHISTSAALAADTLSRLLDRLPPSLSLPSRRRPSLLSSAAVAGDTSSVSPPVISLSDDKSLLSAAASEHGFFQLTNHEIPSQLANSAESESLALFDLSDDQREMQFPRNWPLGYEAADGTNGASFWFDSAAEFHNSAELSELTRAMERLGLEVIEKLARAVGFENPTNPTRVCSMMVVSEDSGESPRPMGGGFYPYVVGLQYQIRRRKQLLMTDSGSGSWVTVLPEVDSVLVTLGDIGQVWTNGKIKKVRGMGVGSSEQDDDDNNNNKSRLGSSSRRSIKMTLLITLPLESTISPIMKSQEKEEEQEEEGYRSIGMEDYAWRVYNEPFIFKDPLHKYRSLSFPK